MKLRVLDLFSGIGGFSLGLERTGGFSTAAFCEYEKFPRSILKKHWPDVPCFSDVRELKGSDIDGPVDVICGGYPCQPFSTAGQRRGKEDDRHLWPEFSRLVDELRPTWVIGENVAGHVSMGLDDVLSDLEGQGYAARTFAIPACAVAAPHRRDRVWTVAHATQLQRDGSREHRQSSERQIPELGKRSGPQPVAHAVSIGQQGQGEQEATSDCETHSKGKTSDAFHERFRCEWLPEPSLGRRIDGLSAIMDGDLSDAAKARATEILRDMRLCDDPQEIREATGGFDGVSHEEILLAFLCEYEARKNAGRLAVERETTRQECLRSVWNQIELARSSLQSRHNGQFAGEFADALRKLSRDSPSLYPQAWANGFWEDGTERVATGVPRRVDRLKALGNAVVPQIPEMIGYAILEAERAAQ